MKQILLFTFLLLTIHLNAQSSYTIFKNGAEYQSQLVHHAYLVGLEANGYQSLLQDKPTNFELEIPVSSSLSFKVILEENNIFADDFVATSKSGSGQDQPFNYQKGLYYKGKIEGDPTSLVAISFFDNEIIGVISNATGNYVIGAYLPDENYDASTHIIYNDAELLFQSNIDCHTDDNPNNLPQSMSAGGFSPPPPPTNANLGPVEIYIEADHQIFLDHGSLNNAGNYITGFFNVSAVIYANSSIDVVTSQISIWNVSDPYPSSTSTAALNSFAAATQNTFNGDLAHFVSSVNAGNGGLAWVNVLCANYDANSFYGPYAYSNIGTTYSTFPTYSWTVMVFTHETGHNIASPHTHSCAWNGNNTQIDDCGNIASGSPNACYNSSNQIVPAAGGTVMSYCHLNSVGINMSSGFHSQVETLMQNAIMQSSCVSSEPYCEASGQSTTDEWIANFTLDSINNTSGNNGGYMFFNQYTTTLDQGSTTPVSITQGYSGTAYPEHFKVWIDFNQDNDFGDIGEEVFSAGPINTAVSGSVTVPANAMTGTTRLRVAMRYNTAPDTCGTFDFGEVEEYNISIAAVSAVLTANSPTVNNVSCNNGVNGSITLNVSGGTAPYTYNWNVAGSGATLSNLVAGTYSCTITDGVGASVTTGNINITEPTSIVPNVSITQPLCSNNAGAVVVSPTGGTAGYSYNWSSGLGTNASVSNLGAGNYTVTVTDANSCTSTQTVSVNAAPAAIISSGTITNVACSGAPSGSVVLSVSNAVGISTYAWSNSTFNQNLTSVSGGTYSVTITDANGCTNTNSFTVNQPNPISTSLTVTQPTCNSGTGAVSANSNGGTGSLFYSWSGGLGGSSTQNNLSAGTYTVTTTDANGCFITNSITINTPPPAIGITGTVVAAGCGGATTGSVTISTANTVGTTTYAWSNNTFNQNLTNVAAGSYTVTVTDANGCTGTNTFAVNAGSSMSATVGITQPVCNTDLGSASVNITGGAGGYTYAWSNNTTGATATNLQAGTVTVTITDANGCATTSSATVQTPPAAIAIAPSVVNAACNGDVNGSIAVILNNATMPATYAWSNNNSGAVVNNLAAGTYSVTVTDANNCTQNGTFTVSEPAVISANATVSANACNGNSGAISVTPSGGTPPYVITPNSLVNLPGGNYTVSVTDANNCPAATKVLDIATSSISAFTTSIIERTVDFTNQSQFADSYLWMFGDGSQSVANSPTYTYQTSGDFTASLITTNICGTDTSSFDFTVFLVGTEEVMKDDRIEIYPNPVSDILNIDFKVEGNWQLKLYDITGRLLVNQNLNINRDEIKQLNVSQLETGTYVVVFQSLDDAVQITKKIIVK